MTLPDADKYDVHFDLESEQQQWVSQWIRQSSSWAPPLLTDLSPPLPSRLALLRAEREDKMFPDEVDTPTDTLAKIRFQK